MLVASVGGTIVAKCFRGWLARARQRIGGRQGAFGLLMSNRTRPESPPTEPAAKKPCAKPTPPKQVNPPPKWKLRGYDLDLSKMSGWVIQWWLIGRLWRTSASIAPFATLLGKRVHSLVQANHRMTRGSRVS